MAEKPPFRESLTASKINNVMPNKLFEFEKNKTKIIRQFPLKDFPEIFDNKLSMEDSVSKAKKLFDEVREKYNIEAPVDYVIGKNKNGADTFFIITDKIEAANLENTEISKEENEKIVSDFKKLFNSLINYVEDKYTQREWMMWDIAGRQQYVYGKKSGKTEEKPYLIDTDLKYAGSAELFVFTYLRELILFISYIEIKLKTKFSTERNQMMNFLKKIKPEDKKFKDFDIKVINELLGSTK